MMYLSLSCVGEKYPLFTHMWYNGIVIPAEAGIFIVWSSICALTI